MRRGLVLGCGGTLGMSWTLATLHALEQEGGWDAREAAVILGTSAGAELACLLGGGAAVADLLAAQQGDPRAPGWIREHLAAGPGAFPPLPRTAHLTAPRLALEALRGRIAPLTGLTGLLPLGTEDPAWLYALADRMSGGADWVAHPDTRLVAVDLASGDRVAFGTPGAPVATIGQALHASWGLPGWMPPAPIAGGRYVDGGVVSPASADLLADDGLDEVVVLAPMASVAPGRPVGILARAERLIRGPMSRRLAQEIATLEAAGTRVRRYDPCERDLAAMGGNFMDPRRRAATLAAAATSVSERLVARGAGVAA